MPLGAFGVSWTLAIEEQFYVILPGLLMLKRWFVLILVVTFFVSTF